MPTQLQLNRQWTKEEVLKLADDMESFIASSTKHIKRTQAHKLGSALKLVLSSVDEPHRKLRKFYKEIETKPSN